MSEESGKVLKFKDPIVDAFTCAEITVQVLIPNFEPMCYTHMVSRHEAEEHFGLARLPRDKDLAAIFPFYLDRDIRLSEVRARQIEQARLDQIPRLGQYIGMKIAYFIQTCLEKIDKTG